MSDLPSQTPCKDLPSEHQLIPRYSLLLAILLLLGLRRFDKSDYNESLTVFGVANYYYLKTHKKIMQYVFQ